MTWPQDGMVTLFARVACGCLPLSDSSCAPDDRGPGRGRSLLLCERLLHGRRLPAISRAIFSAALLAEPIFETVPILRNGTCTHLVMLAGRPANQHDLDLQCIRPSRRTVGCQHHVAVSGYRLDQRTRESHAARSPVMVDQRGAGLLCVRAAIP